MLLNGRLVKEDHFLTLLVISDITEREEIIEKLLISETRYRKLFETAKDGILIIDPLTEKIIDANPYFLETIGYKIKEVIGKHLWEVGTFMNEIVAKKMFQKLKIKGYVRYEDMPLLTKDKREIDVEFVSNLYPINSVSMIQCNIRNITQRKRAEEKAKEYLESLKKMNSFMTGRELRMIELKAEIAHLKQTVLETLP